MNAPGGTFWAMNTTVEILGVGVSEVEVATQVERAREFAVGWERIFSRFLPGSTLQAVNAAGGVCVEVEPVFLDVLQRAQDATVASGGRFNPAMLPALEAAGYDRSFEQVVSLARTEPVAGSRLADWGAVEIDRRKRTVCLPRGMRLDFGGIAKGVFVDQVANRLAHWPGGMVNVGGDMMLWGDPPSGAGWRIGVEDPAQATIDIATIALDPGVRRGVATSATNRRQWLIAGKSAHHLIDPARGKPVAGSVASVTVVATNATEADIGAKVVFLGYADGDERLPTGIELAVVVDTSGGVVVNDGQGGRTHAA